MFPNKFLKKQEWEVETQLKLPTFKDTAIGGIAAAIGSKFTETDPLKKFRRFITAAPVRKGIGKIFTSRPAVALASPTAMAGASIGLLANNPSDPMGYAALTGMGASSKLIADKIKNPLIQRALSGIVFTPAQIAKASRFTTPYGLAATGVASLVNVAREAQKEFDALSPEEQKEFGKGSIKGLAAPETANNAACTGSFVPLLTLGIPGSGTTAILLGALIALNVQPGPRLMVDNPEIFWGVIVSMYLGNIVLLILNLPLIPYIAKLLPVPRNYLIPFILFFTLMGAYIGQNNETELLLLIFLGFAATILKFADYPLAPLLIGFILGSMLENNFARAMNIYDGFGFVL